MTVFLDLLRRRNPALLSDAIRLHQAGQLPPNVYVIDLDAVERNAARLRSEASALGLRPFAMTKQIGRNPDALAAIRRGGITEAVGVDLECAAADAAAAGLTIGHLGHLVQVPRVQATIATELKPRYWTVFSEQKAREAGEAASRAGYVQDVLLRIVGDGDRFYAGHEGGFPAEDVVAVANALDKIDGIRVAGITTFPATLFDREAGTVRSTPNLATLTSAKKRLLDSGREEVELNAPGTTSTAMLHTLAEAGATQVEPGHGLTGTTPWHAVEDLAEEPAIAYVTEVSHLWNDRAYVFGGGLYVDPVLPGPAPTTAIIVPARGGLEDSVTLPVEMPAPQAIDYYATIPLNGSQVQPGDTVLFGFRPQVFVSRGLTAGIANVGSGSPRVTGLWASNGARPLQVGEHDYALPSTASTGDRS
jgi:predicted amino acid racemase